MANHWNSKDAILRDLSVAQGRRVPAEINNTVAQDEKPPRLILIEDTGEEFYENCVGGGDYNAGPDLAIIQHMLDVVRKPSEDNSEDNIESTGTVLETPTKQNKLRNAAVESLLNKYGEGDLIENGSHPRLASPQTSASDLLKPIYHRSWLQNSANMFKKKTPSTKSLDTTSMLGQSLKPEIRQEHQTPMLEQPGVFVPSSLSNEYYHKYMETSKLQEQGKEDIWSRAERQMREIDAKRKYKATSPMSNKSSSSESHSGI